MMSDLNEGQASSAASERLVGLHPLLAHEVNSPLWTPPIRQAYDACKLCILQRRSFYLSEQSGEGKTTLLRAMCEELLKDFGDSFAVAYHTTDTKQVPSIRAFYIQFLWSLEHPKLSGETPILKKRMHQSMEVLASASQWGTVLLLLDEAQALLPEDFGFIKDMQNHLHRKNLTLIVISVGDLTLRQKLEGMRDHGPADACADRFGLHRIRLSGYDKYSLRALFRAIDSKVWPAGSGQTWTRYFFPQAFDNGFRFESHVESFWDAFASIGELRTIEISNLDKKTHTVLLSRRIFDALSYMIVRTKECDFSRGILGSSFWLQSASHASGLAHD